MRTAILLINLGLAFSSPISNPEDDPICHNGCKPLSADKINVHLIPHSHDDVGWVKTYDQYYTGTGYWNAIENAGVQYILNSTIAELGKNPERRYIQVETAFFYKWWNQQNETVRQSVRDLLQQGRLEITNGAWSMNDEAAAHYQSIIDQFTWGFRILEDTVGPCGRTKTGWQIDPFGHSREHASILTQLGFNGLIIGRLDYRDKQKRIREQNLDFYWNTNDNFPDPLLFTSMFPDFYVYPNSFCFDIYCYELNIDDSNVKERVATFASIMDSWKGYYKTRNMLIPMGHDFSYQVAEKNFNNMDRLIEGFKDHETYNVIYSTPSCYIQAVKSEIVKNKIPMTVKDDDFFPYASDTHEYWTGYFTSRPTSKRFERLGNNILQSVKQLTTYSRVNGQDDDKNILNLRMSMGIMQHHDAITGTEKQAVADDYSKLLHRGIEDTEESVSNIILDLLKKNKIDINLDFAYCLRRNESICDATKSNSFVVALQNPLSKPVNHYVRLPVDNGDYKVTGPDGDVAIDIFDTIHSFQYINNAEPASKELVFLAKNIPALGVQLYHIQKLTGDANYHPFGDIDNGTFGDNTINFTIGEDGKLSSVNIKGVDLKLQQDFYYYDGANSWSGRASGAYIFKPTGEANVITDNVTVRSARGQLVDEVHQIFNNEITQIIRVYKDLETPYVEFDWLVGNLSTGSYGKEIISRIKIDNFQNGDIFYTDSNGRQQIKRQRDKRNDYEYDASEEPITSNYYPVTTKIVIKDELKNLELALLNDRAQGGSSLREGEIELMVHRRDVGDDGFGVNEVLREDQYGVGLFARGQHYLTVDSINQAAALERDLALKTLLAPVVLISKADDISLEAIQAQLNFEFYGLTNDLPDNVHILTLEPWKDSYLLRLEHIFEKNEDEVLSKPVIVGVANLFTLFNITEINETTLGANKLLESSKPDGFDIELGPMEIRTFLFKTNKNNDGGHENGIVN